MTSCRINPYNAYNSVTSTSCMQKNHYCILLLSFSLSTSEIQETIDRPVTNAFTQPVQIMTKPTCVECDFKKVQPCSDVAGMDLVAYSRWIGVFPKPLGFLVIWWTLSGLGCMCGPSDGSSACASIRHWFCPHYIECRRLQRPGVLESLQTTFANPFLVFFLSRSLCYQLISMVQ